MRNSSACRENYGVRGFTLIELLVVLVILALVAGVAGPAMFRAKDRAALEAAAAQVYDDLRRARSRAVTQSVPVTLPLSHLVEDKNVAIEMLPKNSRRNMLIFYPDGSATGARFNLVLGEDRRSLALDWLTGNATLVE